ncbi:MAG: DUF63 family protein [Candidatus Micrarchaeota archaeon]|nr:DUF63 family protein [Candidatus Micrarchaeota archaeon]MCX8154257.1 DUF63 family protein [Candidatus Micrarchaeota archaeon]
MDFIYEYFIGPIERRESYNIVNTTVYAILGVIFFYLIYLFFKSRDIKFMDLRMLNAVIPYAATGGVIRALVDLTESGQREGIYSLYVYSLWNVTPGIYFVMAGIFVFFYYLEHRYNITKFTQILGYAILIFHFFLILPHINRLEGIVPLIMAYIPAIILSSSPYQFYAYFGQGLDGASTFFAVEVIGGYKEKHILAGLIGENTSYFVFYLLKLLLVYIIDRKYKLLNLSEDDQKVLLGLAAVLGVGIGVRNTLRIIMGV